MTSDSAAELTSGGRVVNGQGKARPAPAQLEAEADRLLWCHTSEIADAVAAAESSGGPAAARRVLDDLAAASILAPEVVRRHVRAVTRLRAMGLPQFERDAALPIGVATLIVLDRRADEATQRALLERCRNERLSREEVRRQLRAPVVPVDWRRGGDLWWFERCDPRFGREGPDRLPGQVAQNLFDRFLPDGGSVLSAMTGDGTVMDVAAATPKVGRYLGFDLAVDPDVLRRHPGRMFPFEPTRPDWRPACREPVDMVVVTPPLFRFVARGRKDAPTDLANIAELDAYMAALQGVIAGASSVLLAGGVFALVTRQTADFGGAGPVYNLVRELAQAVEDLIGEVFLGAPVIAVGRRGAHDPAGEWLVPVARHLLVYRKVA